MRAPASTDRDREVLDLWERGVGLDRWRRDDALLADDAPRALGARNIALVGLRNRLFDRGWPLKSTCPACATECDFEIDGPALAGHLRLPGEPGGSFDWNGLTLTARPPTVEDLAAVSRATDRASAASDLLGRCIGGPLDVAALDDAGIEALGQRLERLDPAALVSFELACPACRHPWSAALDVGEALWLELQRAAERLLADVDSLARAYGWTEAEVMRLSPTRRAAYLQMVGSA
ncbi:hypothetical protein [Reyranella sp.]|uniref:hypothetical protein n=1 Tax=Reyranella sp. TaxID=1929291 RepID=UPI003BA84613